MEFHGLKNKRMQVPKDKTFVDAAG